MCADFKALSSYKTYDEYYTPKWVWSKIRHLVPKECVIWEACMLDAKNSKSMEIWKDFGYDIVGNIEWYIFTCDIPQCNIIITNIPFGTEIKKKVLTRLMEIDKPFIIIMNICNTFANYFRNIMDLENTQIIIPKGKLHFQKDGEKEEKNTSFYSCFVAYKMNLKTNQLWI